MKKLLFTIAAIAVAMSIYVIKMTKSEKSFFETNIEALSGPETDAGNLCAYDPEFFCEWVFPDETIHVDNMTNILWYR